MEITAGIGAVQICVFDLTRKTLAALLINFTKNCQRLALCTHICSSLLHPYYTLSSRNYQVKPKP